MDEAIQRRPGQPQRDHQVQLARVGPELDQLSLRLLQPRRALPRHLLPALRHLRQDPPPPQPGSYPPWLPARQHIGEYATKRSFESWSSSLGAITANIGFLAPNLVVSPLLRHVLLRTPLDPGRYAARPGP